MILDSNSPGVKPTLMHLRNLISKYEDKWVDSRTFSESYKEIEVLGNSMHDLDPKSFRQFIMSEADCYFFYREDKIIEKNYFIEDPVSIKDDDEYSGFIDQWRENNDLEYLKLWDFHLLKANQKQEERKQKFKQVFWYKWVRADAKFSMNTSQFFHQENILEVVHRTYI